MVYSVSTGNLRQNIAKTTNTEDVKKLIKYVGNQTITEIPDTFTSTTKSALGTLAVFNGIPFLKFLVDNKKATGNFLNKEAAKLTKYNREAFKAIFQKGGKVGEKISNFFNVTANTAEQYSGIKKAVKGIAKAKKTGEVVTDAMKAAAKAKPVAAAAVKTTSKGVLGKLGKAIKSSGAIGMMIFSGAIECATEVVPTFKELGKEKGMKQLGKSAIKVAGDTVGYLAAAKAGSAIGSLISPGVGTALGFVAGFLGSFVAGKITKKITGKTEREIAAEQELNKAAKEISGNNDAYKQLKQAASQKLQLEQSNGTANNDSKIISSILNKQITPQKPFRVTV